MTFPLPVIPYILLKVPCRIFFLPFGRELNVLYINIKRNLLKSGSKVFGNTFRNGVPQLSILLLTDADTEEKNTRLKATKFNLYIHKDFNFDF